MRAFIVFMPPRDITPELQEAFRRRAQLGPPSTAGIQGGAQTANRLSAVNPLASSVPPSTLGQAPQPPNTMSQPGVEQLGKSAPGEAEIILKALIQRLRNLAPTGGSNAPA